MRVLLCTHTYTISAPSAQPEPHLRSDAIIVPSPLHHMQNSCRSISEREPYPETKVQKPTNVAIAHFCQQIRGRRDDILVNVIHKSRQRQTQSKNSLSRWNTSDHQARIYATLQSLSHIGGERMHQKRKLCVVETKADVVDSFKAS